MMAFAIRVRSLTVLWLALLALTACAGSAATIPTTSPSASAAPVAALTTCETVKAAFAEALGLEVAITETMFTDNAGGTERQGCQLTAKGTGTQITDFIGGSQQLSTLLTNQGWGTAQPLADGPTGTVIGFNGGNTLGQLTVEWTPAPAANCPQDKPISDCDLLPEQKLYSITFQVAALEAARVSPSATDEALQQAVHTYVMENTEVRTFTLAVDGVEGDVARVRVVPAPGTADPSVAYAHHDATGWSVLAIGSDFDPAFYERHAIPKSLQLGHS